MIVLFDHHTGVGGGQVVLSDLNEHLHPTSPVIVAAPVALIEALWPDPESRPNSVLLVHPWSDTAAQLVRERRNAPRECWILFANTYPAIIGVLRTGRHLRRRGEPVVTVAVMHSYPGSRMRRQIVRKLLGRVDHRVPVEPNLSELASDLEPMPILVAPAVEVPLSTDYQRTNVVKSYARSDPSKGLHLLPEVFRECERGTALRCRVAVSSGLESRGRYAARVKRALEPWLLDGRRSAAWIQPGDIFVVASLYGEAVSLTVQEAMLRGAYVVAPRLGAIPSLGSPAAGLVVYSPGDRSEMVAAIRQAATMPAEEFVRRCAKNQSEISGRVGEWYARLETLAETWSIRGAESGT